MVTKFKDNNSLLSISKIFGILNIYLLLGWLVLGIINYLTNPETPQINPPIIFVIPVFLAATGILVVLMILAIKYNHPFLGGIFMGLLGLGMFSVAAFVNAEAVWLQAAEIDPTGPNYFSFIPGFLLLAGGFLAILGSDKPLVLKLPVIIGSALVALFLFNGMLQNKPPLVQQELADTPEGAARNFLTTLNKGNYSKAYTYLSENLPHKPNLELFATYNDMPRFRNTDFYRSWDIQTERSEITTEGKAKIVIAYHPDPRISFLETGSIITEEFQLQQEHGTWRITGLSPRYIPLYSSYNRL